ncbi:hypothetical protein MNBD_GAMMA18-2115, partial [hydrothermal vent metagenome]
MSLLFGLLVGIFLVILLMPTREAQGAISYVQKVAGYAQDHGFSTLSVTIPVTAAVTAGNSIIISTAWAYSGSGVAFTCSDDAGNSYSTDVSSYSSGALVYTVICSAHNVIALGTSNNITVTTTDPGGNATGAAISVYEFSGLLPASPLDQISSAFGPSGTPAAVSSGDTAMTTQANELLFGAFGADDDSSPVFTTGGSYTLLESVRFGGGLPTHFSTEYRTVSTTGAYRADGSLSDVDWGWSAVIATYKAAPDITLSGTLYSDEGTTPASGQTVRLVVEGASVGTDITDINGDYSITTTINPANIWYIPLLVYVDDSTVDATTVTAMDSTINSATISDLDLYADRLIIRLDTGGASLDTGDMSNAKDSYSDSDILYSISWPDLTVTGANTELYVASGHSFTPSGNVTTTHMKILGTLTAGSNTFTVSGNWEYTNGTFDYGTSTVDFTGSGTISVDLSNWWIKRFYNVNAAAIGQTTTILASRGIVVQNILTLGTGTLAGGDLILGRNGGTPLVTAGATLSNSQFKYTPWTNPVNITSTDYPDLWIASGSPGSDIEFTLLGDISCNNLLLMGNGNNKSTLNTANNSITCNQLQIGDSLNNRHGKLLLNNSMLTVNGNVDIYPNTGDTNEIDAGSATINVGGNWTNNDTFTAGTSTVTMDGNTDQNITSFGNSFNNLVLNNTGPADIILNDTLDINSDLTITSGTLDTTSTNNYNITVLGNLDQSSTTSELEANASTITVTGDFSADGTFDNTNYNNASVELIGSGTLSYENLAPATAAGRGFKNLTVGQPGQTTTLTPSLTFNVKEVLAVGSGTLTSTGSASIYLSGANPLNLDLDATISIRNLKFFGNGPAQTFPPLNNGYDTHIFLAGHNTSVIQTSDITLNAGKNLYLSGDTFANRAVNYNTNGYKLNVGGRIRVGWFGNGTASKTLDISDSTVTVGENFEILAGTNNLISTSSTVILNGTGAQAVTMNGKAMDVLTLNNTSVAGVTFNDAFTANSVSNTLPNNTKTLTFAAGQDFTVNNAFNLQGTNGQLINFVSSSPGTHWNFVLNNGAAKTINYVNVSWSDASGSGSTHTPILPTNSINGGNNIEWFGANISINKTNTLISDPVNGTGAGRKHIPGAIVEYAITTTNSGDSSPDANSITITDPIDGNVEYDVSSISFTAYNSGLIGTITYSHNDTPTIYNYSPVGSYDPNVASIKITTSGAFNHTDTPDPRFT